MLTRGVLLPVQNHSDEAMLETDIMRFLAIMALCMMVIFSLVQSLPKTEKPEPSVPLETTDAVQVEQLKHQLGKMTAELQQLKQDAEAKKQQIQQQGKQNHFKNLVVDLNQQLSSSQQQTQQLDQQLQGLQKDKLVDKIRWQAKMSELQNKLDQVQQKLQSNTQLLKAISGAKTKSVATKKAVVKTPVIDNVEPKPNQAATPKAVKKPAKKGFSLRFANDAALAQLVQQGRVELWRKSGNSYQRWLGSRWQNTNAKGQLYQMAAHTVPAQYRKQAVGNGQRQWFVALPGGVRTQINTLMKQQAGGELVIDASSKVRLK